MDQILANSWGDCALAIDSKYQGLPKEHHDFVSGILHVEYQSGRQSCKARAWSYQKLSKKKIINEMMDPRQLGYP